MNKYFIIVSVIPGLISLILSPNRVEDLDEQTKHAIKVYYLAGIYMILLGILASL